MVDLSFDKNLFVLAVVVINFIQCSCECRRSYTVICDTISDFKEEYDSTWTDVIIKSDNPETSPTTAFEFMDFRKLTSLVIVGQINDISTAQVPYCKHKTTMKFLSLYENILVTLKQNFFSHKLQLNKLSLINNKIETIEAGTFTTPQVEVIDLSDNLLEIIVSNTFTNKDSKNFMKAIIVQNNKLAHIEPDTFPLSLRVLKLDNNELRFLQNGVIDVLVNLRGLFISHNKFSTIPNVKTLKNLVILDMSHNSVSRIDSDAFENLEKLEELDLSYNKIKRAEFLKPLLLTNQRDLYISLAFNRFHDLKLKINSNVSLDSKSLILFGNPWWCHKWTSIQKNLNEMDLKQTKCDLAYFDSGKLPFCISFQGKPVFFVNNSTFEGYTVLGTTQLEVSEDEIKNFVNAIQPNLGQIDCKLSVKKYSYNNILYSDLVLCNAPALVLVSPYN